MVKQDDKATIKRRDFLKTAVVTASSAAAFLATVKFNTGEGVKVAQSSMSVDMSEASASCGASYNCSGGGGQCGASYNCSGGGGQCGASYNCSGGGGSCGASYDCTGE